MCNKQQVPSVTLQSAVLMQVKAFAQNNTPFSVHDITRTIRQKTSQGELEIPEVEVQGASFRFDIPHPKVKALFDELWTSGVFDPDFSLSRKFNGMYFEYTPTAIGGGALAGISVTPQAAPSAGVPANTPTASTATAPGASCTDAAVEDRIKQYIYNCGVRKYQPTLKNVQSAIKRGDRSTGWSCETLKATIIGFGYTVVDHPDSASKAQVVTVV